MKIFQFLGGAALLAVAVAYPHQDEQQQRDPPTCRLAGLVGSSNFEMPEINIDGDTEVSIEDPLHIENGSVALNERILKGNYSLVNGLVEGLSTLTHDFDYNASNQRFSFNSTLKRVHLTGLYEIVDGQANLTTLGEHTFHGKGPLNASASGVAATLGFTLIINPQTQHLSVGGLKIDFAFDNAYITAENLVVDGVPVNWEEFNPSIRQFYESVWVGEHDVTVERIQNRINWSLKGCTLMDLMALAKPRQDD